jgi:hypothetical protein
MQFKKLSPGIRIIRIQQNATLFIPLSLIKIPYEKSSTPKPVFIGYATGSRPALRQ